MRARTPLLLLATLGALAIPVLLWLVASAPVERNDLPRAARDPDMAAARQTSSGARDLAPIGAPVDARLDAPVEARVVATGLPALDVPRAPRTRRIAGRVVRASDGTPLAGATVGAAAEDASDVAPSSPSSPDDPGEQASRRLGRTSPHPGTETRAPDGAFELDVPADARRLRVVLASGWPRRPLLVDLPSPGGDVRDLSIVYDSGFIVRGVVSDVRGAPIRSASVSAGSRGTAGTDDQGRYQLKDVAPWPGVNALDAEAGAADFAARTQPVAVPPDSTQVVTADFALPGLGALEGDVTGVSHEPLPDVDIWALLERPDGRGQQRRTGHHAVTDAAGHYRLDGLPDGSLELWISSEHVSEQYFADSWSDAEGGRCEPETLTSFDLPPFERSRMWTERGLAGATIGGVEVIAGETSRQDAVLDAGATIEGRVTDADGEPLRNFEVCAWTRSSRRIAPQILHHLASEVDPTLSRDFSAWPWAPGASWWSAWSEDRAWTDDQGRYVLQHVSPGTVHVTAEWTKPSIDLVNQSVDARTIDVPRGGALTGVDFALSREQSLRHRVVGPDGEPAQGARGWVGVTADGSGNAPFWERSRTTFSTGFSDAEGTLYLRVLPGTHALMMTAPGYIALQETITSGEPERTFVMQPSVTLQILVEDAMTQSRLSRFDVLVTNAEETDRWYAGDDCHGTLLVERNADVRCDVTITADGHLPQTIRDVLPSSTARSQPLVIRLQPSS